MTRWTATMRRAFALKMQRARKAKSTRRKRRKNPVVNGLKRASWYQIRVGDKLVWTTASKKDAIFIAKTFARNNRGKKVSVHKV